MIGKMKMLCILAVLLILLGGLIFTVAMSIAGWDFTVFLGGTTSGQLSVSGDFDSIRVNADVSNVTILPSDDATCKIEYSEREGFAFSHSVSDGVLTLSINDERPWYRMIIGSGRSAITLYLPKEAYTALAVDCSTGKIDLGSGITFGSLTVNCSTADVILRVAVSGTADVKVSTGDLLVENTTLGALNFICSTGDLTVLNTAMDSLSTRGTTGDIRLSGLVCTGDIAMTVTTGDTRLSDVICNRLNTTGGTGDLELIDVVCSGALAVKRSTGEIVLKSADAAEITITTDTGDVCGSLRTAKIFIVSTDTGKIDLPESATGGVCRITTDTGDVKLRFG